MSKRGIINTGPAIPALVGSDGEELFTPLPKVKEVKPCGSLVLLEILTQQEVLGTRFTIMEGKSPMAGAGVGAPQAWVRATGPGFKEDTYGFKTGDRVLLSTGVAVPVPRPDDSKRDWCLVEPGAVRGVIVEEKDE